MSARESVLHIVPVGDFIEHNVSGTMTCPCNPTASDHDDIATWVVRHCPLDGRGQGIGQWDVRHPDWVSP
jgi:hypothetical protein